MSTLLYSCETSTLINAYDMMLTIIFQACQHVLKIIQLTQRLKKKHKHNGFKNKTININSVLFQIKMYSLVQENVPKYPKTLSRYKDFVPFFIWVHMNFFSTDAMQDTTVAVKEAVSHADRGRGWFHRDGILALNLGQRSNYVSRWE